LFFCWHFAVKICNIKRFTKYIFEKFGYLNKTTQFYQEMNAMETYILAKEGVDGATFLGKLDELISYYRFFEFQSRYVNK